MKKLNLYFLTFCIIYIISCREKCVDNLSEYNNKIKYKEKQIVQFSNDTLGIRNDTVFPDIGLPHNLKEQDDDEICSGNSYLYFSNFFVYAVGQAANMYNNEINEMVMQAKPLDYSINLRYPEIIINYPQKDNISFLYNNKTIQAHKISYPTDILGSPIWEESLQNDTNYVYNDYI